MGRLLRAVEMFDMEGMVPAVVTADTDQLGHPAGAVATPVYLENVVDGIGGLRANKGVIQIGMGG
jgi:hypothetical protein